MPVPGKKRQQQYRERLFLQMKCQGCRVKVIGTYCEKCLINRREQARQHRVKKKGRVSN